MPFTRLKHQDHLLNIKQGAPATGALFALCLFVSAPWSTAIASESCKPEQFAELVDATGAYLRTFASKNKPLLDGKIQQLARRRGWPADSAIERGYSFVQDAKIAELDTRARKLVIELDEIDSNSESDHTCKRLERLKSVTLEMRVVTQTKFTHMVKRVDSALNLVAKAPAKSKTSGPIQVPKPKRPVPRTVAPGNSIGVASANPPSRPSAAWKTEIQSAPTPTISPTLNPEPLTTTYSAREIRQAGQGFFGNLSANLAAVLRYAFKTYGKPNGYILGTEGGGALLAGVSYGKGQLNSKTSQPIRVFWQSPTVGYDLGVQTSRVMLLVYDLGQPENIFRRFAGIGGSAYVVGGAGLTIHKRGRVVLAPIRTGIGLRVGANIGYLKFTPRFSINPF